MKYTNQRSRGIGWPGPKSLLAAGALVAGALGASASDLTQTNSVGLPFLATPWTRSVGYSKFNPAFGTLQRVDLIVRNNVRSSIRVENLTDQPGLMIAGSTATINVVGTLSVTPLATVQATAAVTNAVTAFDGVVDFGGPTGNSGSGFSVPGVNGFTISDVGVVAGDPNMGQFIGPGAGTLSVNSTGQTFAQGPGDSFTQILTSSGTELKIIYTYTPFFASAGDRVWVDLNSDGIQDEGEPGIPGVTVTLLDASGAAVPGILPQTTGSDGEYLFSGIYINPLDQSQLFKVAVSQPAGYQQTYDLDDGPTTAPGTLLEASFSLNYDEDRTDVDFGFVQPSQSIGDRVWHDENGNGQQDPGEVGIANATVTLFAAGDLVTPVATQNTDSDGKYMFTGLAVGTYTVSVSGVPAIFRQTFDLDDGFLLTGFLTPNQAADVSVGAGEVRSDVDFGYQQVNASVGDYVWLDRNRNGIQDSGETPLAGVAVQLRDSSGTVLETATTGSNGQYLFSNLAQGSYAVTVTAPAGYDQTFDLDDGAAPSGGFASPDSAAFSLATGEAKTDVDFGYGGGQIGDRVWSDLNGNGIQDSGEPGIGGVLVTLTTGTGTLTTTTDGSGFYTFGNQELPAGTYTVSVAAPPGYQQTYDLDDGARLTGFTSANSASVVLSAGQSRDDADFGYQQLASLGDRVWLDYNGNGVQESGETGIAGRTVVLFQVVSGVPTQIGTAITDSAGLYSFPGLTPGDYRVTVQNPPVKHITTWDFDDQGGAPVTQHTALVTLAAGQTRNNVDFGYQPLGSIGNTVWLDVNKNGVQDGVAEVGISGATVTISSSTVGTLTVLTDSNGQYLFDSLPAAVYTVSVQLPVGVLVDQTYDLDDGFRLSGFTSPNQAVGALLPGEDRVDFDFGYAPTAAVENSTIGNLVWNDLDGSGTQNGSEVGIPNVTVQLYLNGNMIRTTTTGGAGNYLFTGLAAGDYVVKVLPATLPAGMVATYDLDDSVAPFNTTDEAFGTVGVNGSNLDFDFGYRVPPPPPPTLNTLGDYVWFDSNRNGLQDATEIGYGGVKVELLLGTAGTTVVDTEVTGSNGGYLFDNTPDGTYRVRFTLPSNYSFASKNANGNLSDAADSDVNQLSGVTDPITLAGGQDVRTTDAGLVNHLLDVCVEEALYAQSVSGGNPLCNKILSPGYWRNWRNHYTTSQFQAIISQTSNYSGLNTTQVTDILKNTGNQYARHLMAAQLTAASSVSFRQGIYTGAGYNGQTVQQILVTAANTSSTSASQNLRNAVLYLGADGENVCGAACKVVTPGSTVMVGHAVYLPGIGTDFIFDPTSGNFFENADGTATLTGFVRSKSNPTRGFAISVVASGYSDVVPTSPAGSPKLELPANQYIGGGGIIDPATWTYYTSFTGTLTGFGFYQGAVLNITRTGPSLQIGFGANGKNNNWGMSAWFNWTVASQPSGCGALPSGQGDFNVDLIDCAANGTTGSIGDKVWFDSNSNGVQNAGEPGIANVTVQLLSSAGVLLGQTKTDANGTYVFTELAAGSYRVTVVPPANRTRTFDLDGVATANTTSVSLTNGQIRTDVDFGYKASTCP